MADKNEEKRGAGELRARALQRVSETPASTTQSHKPPSQEDRLRLIHELQVHQIELEMQNEELSRSYEELEASRARYFELYDLAPVGYLSLSKQGKIVEVNLTAATLLGVERGALAGKQFSAFVLPEDQGVFHGKCAHLGDGGAQHSWEIRMLRPDGSSLWANLQAEQAQSGECRITLNDISERKRVEATLARFAARLRQLQKAESLERMAAAWVCPSSSGSCGLMARRFRWRAHRAGEARSGSSCRCFSEEHRRRRRKPRSGYPVERCCLSMTRTLCAM